MTVRPSFVGVDGGGTKTDIAVVDANGEVLARRQGSTSNKSVIGQDAAAEVLQSLISETCREANVEVPITAGWIGLAGSDRQEDRDSFHASLDPWFQHVNITNDAELVLSGTPNGVGIALIGGTGSIAVARNERGELRRSGGWGHVFGDEGSAYALGVEGLRAVAAASDGRGPASVLTERLTDYWHAATTQQLITIVYSAEVTKSDIAASAPVIVEAASAGDPVAVRLLDEAADELAKLVISLASAMSFRETPPVAITGGLLLGSKELRDRLSTRLASAPVQHDVMLVTDLARSAALGARRQRMEKTQ